MRSSLAGPELPVQDRQTHPSAHNVGVKMKSPKATRSLPPTHPVPADVSKEGNRRHKAPRKHLSAARAKAAPPCKSQVKSSCPGDVEMLPVPYLVRRLWARTPYLCFCPTSQCGPGHRNKTRSIELVSQVPLLLLSAPRSPEGFLPGEEH